MTQVAARCSSTSTAVTPTARPNSTRLLSSPARSAKPSAVETAGGCMTSSTIISTIVATIAVPPETYPGPKARKPTQPISAAAICAVTSVRTLLTAFAGSR